MCCFPSKTVNEKIIEYSLVIILTEQFSYQLIKLYTYSMNDVEVDNIENYDLLWYTMIYMKVMIY